MRPHDQHGSSNLTLFWDVLKTLYTVRNWTPSEYCNLLNFAFASPKWHSRYEWEVVGVTHISAPERPILSHSQHLRAMGCSPPKYNETIRIRDSNRVRRPSPPHILPLSLLPLPYPCWAPSLIPSHDPPPPPHLSPSTAPLLQPPPTLYAHAHPPYIAHFIPSQSIPDPMIAHPISPQLTPTYHNRHPTISHLVPSAHPISAQPISAESSNIHSHPYPSMTHTLS